MITTVPVQQVGGAGCRYYRWSGVELVVPGDCHLLWGSCGFRSIRSTVRGLSCPCLRCRVLATRTSTTTRHLSACSLARTRTTLRGGLPWLWLEPRFRRGCDACVAFGAERKPGQRRGSVCVCREPSRVWSCTCASAPHDPSAGVRVTRTRHQGRSRRPLCPLWQREARRWCEAGGRLLLTSEPRHAGADATLGAPAVQRCACTRRPPPGHTHRHPPTAHPPPHTHARPHDTHTPTHLVDGQPVRPNRVCCEELPGRHTGGGRCVEPWQGRVPRSAALVHTVHERRHTLAGHAVRHHPPRYLPRW